MLCESDGAVKREGSVRGKKGGVSRPNLEEKRVEK